MAPPVDAVLTFVSGLPLVLLGVALLVLRPRRREAVFFGAFAAAWGASVALANLGRVAQDAQLHHVSLLLSYAFYIPAWLFLVHFATMIRPRRWSWAVSAAATALAFVAGAILVAAPELLVVSVEGGAGPPTSTTFGPAAFPLVAAPVYLAFYAAIAVLYAEYRRAPAGTPRHRVRGVLIALLLFASYASLRLLLFYLGPAVGVRGAGNALGPVLLFLAGTAFVLALAVHLAARPPPPEERDRLLLAAIGVPAAVAVVEAALDSAGLGIETLGFWRLATVAALAHALARYQLFDLDLRLKPLAGPGLAGASLLAGGAVAGAALVTGGSSTSALPPLAIGAAVAVGALALRRPLAEALFPGVAAEPDYIRRRKLEVYRAALEEKLATSDDDPDLRRLRADLGISQREHEVMTFMTRSRATAAPTAAPRAEAGALVAGRFRVDRLLGEGGYGRALLAHDERDRRNVVLKVVSNAALGGQAAASLVREARLLREIRDPHVIGVLDVLEGPHETVLVLDYAQGGSLAGLLARQRPLAAAAAVRLLEQILAGLAAAHARGIVHRDVKPENVLLDAEGRAKLADFGIAREERPDATGVTGAGAGTLLYMAPEQVRGRAVDARADLYAAAVVFHLCLTGRFYLRIAGKDDFQVRQLIVHAEPELSLKDAPAWVEPFLRRALAKDPAERFASAEAMLAAVGGREALVAA